MNAAACAPAIAGALPSNRNAIIDPETGLVSKPCPHCGELWPLTVDYYHLLRKSNQPVRWQSWCRACVAEWTRAKRERRAVAEGGAS